jgi:hypothetical protein
MLDASDQERLREIEEHLLAEDPTFVARMRGEQEATARRQRASLTVLGGLWLVWLATLLSIGTLGRPVLIADSIALVLLATVTWRVVRRHRRLRAFVVG